MIDTVRRRRRRRFHPSAARFFRWSLRVWNILLEPIQCTVRHWLLLDNSFLYCCGPLAVTWHSFSKRFKLDWLVRAELPLSPLKKKKISLLFLLWTLVLLPPFVWTFDEGTRPGLTRRKPVHGSHFQYCQDWVLYDNECGERKKFLTPEWKKYIQFVKYLPEVHLSKRKKQSIFPEVKSKSKHQTIRG